MNRRFALRSLFGGAVAASQAGSALARKAVAITAPDSGPSEWFAGDVPAPVSDSSGKKWRLLEDLDRPRQRRHHKNTLIRTRLGGFTPQTYSCHSWSPWFRAMVAAKEIEEEASEGRTIYEKLKHQIFGDDA